jgi:hypothetical protein
MPRTLLKKLMPDPEWVKSHKNLRFLGDKLHDPNFWHLNRHSVAAAFAVGFFVTWLPVPGQIIILAFSAFYCRANLPVAFVAVWLTNPITIPPLFYGAYRLGLWLLGKSANAGNLEFSVDSLKSVISNNWEPFLLGCLVMAVLSSTLGYFGSHYFWRWSVARKWAARKRRKYESTG